MPLHVEFSIPEAVYEAAQSEAAWQEVQKYSTTKLLMYLKRWVKSKGWKLNIKKCDPNVAGEHFVSEGEMNLDITLSWADTPAVLVHEVLHSLFFQLDEPKILTLERKIMKEAPTTQICTFVHTILKYGNWKYVGPYNRRV